MLSFFGKFYESNIIVFIVITIIANVTKHNFESFIVVETNKQIQIVMKYSTVQYLLVSQDLQTIIMAVQIFVISQYFEDALFQR